MEQTGNERGTLDRQVTRLVNPIATAVADAVVAATRRRLLDALGPLLSVLRTLEADGVVPAASVDNGLVQPSPVPTASARKAPIPSAPAKPARVRKAAVRKVVSPATSAVRAPVPVSSADNGPVRQANVASASTREAPVPAHELMAAPAPVHADIVPPANAKQPRQDRTGSPDSSMCIALEFLRTRPDGATGAEVRDYCHTKGIQNRDTTGKALTRLREGGFIRLDGGDHRWHIVEARDRAA